MGQISKVEFVILSHLLLIFDSFIRNDGPINWKNVIVYLSQVSEDMFALCYNHSLKLTLI